VVSKRKLVELIREGYVDDWDDPRMPTLSGFRRRGYTPAAIRDFVDRVGVATANSTADFALLEHCLREDLNKHALRTMAVLNPLKVTITNYPEEKVEELEAENNPEDETAGKRNIKFSRNLFVEKEDFREEAPRKWFRFAPGKEVRLKHAYYVTCNEVIKDENGEVIELKCTYDPETRGGWSADGRKVKGALHWVSADHAIDAEIRLFNHLFTTETFKDEDQRENWKQYINPDSVEILPDCKLESGLEHAQSAINYQFIRQGYFVLDSKYSTKEKLCFNRTVGLRDTWARIQRSQEK